MVMINFKRGILLADIDHSFMPSSILFRELYNIPSYELWPKFNWLNIYASHCTRNFLFRFLILFLWQQDSLTSAIIEAQNQPWIIVHNRNVGPKWKDGLIEICDGAIFSFDPIRNEHSGFVKSIMSKIKKKKFQKNLNWRVRINLKEQADDSYASYYDDSKYSLRLKYNNLFIEMSAG